MDSITIQYDEVSHNESLVGFDFVPRVLLSKLNVSPWITSPAIRCAGLIGLVLCILLYRSCNKGSSIRDREKRVAKHAVSGIKY